MKLKLSLSVLVLFLVVFRFCSSSGTARHPRAGELNRAAEQTGRTAGEAVLAQFPQPGSILILHPDPSAPAFARAMVRQKLAGLRSALAGSGLEAITRPVNEANAASDPLADGYYIGPESVRRFAAETGAVHAVLLLGLQIAGADTRAFQDLPPLVLTDTGDPGSSQWALEQGVAAAALFETRAPAGATPGIELRTSPARR